MTLEKFGQKLHTLRQRHRLTTRQLAEKIDISHVQISRLERGQQKPSADLVVRIADYFNVSLDQLMRDEFELD